MKKSLIQTILGMVTLISLMLVCCEAETLIAQILWSGGWLSVSAIFAKLLEGTFTKEELEEEA